MVQLLQLALFPKKTVFSESKGSLYEHVSKKSSEFFIENALWKIILPKPQFNFHTFNTELFREIPWFLVEIFEISKCHNSLIFWATTNLNLFLESSWALLYVAWAKRVPTFAKDFTQLQTLGRSENQGLWHIYMPSVLNVLTRLGIKIFCAQTTFWS